MNVSLLRSLPFMNYNIKNTAAFVSENRIHAVLVLRVFLHSILSQFSKLRFRGSNGGITNK